MDELEYRHLQRDLLSQFSPEFIEHIRNDVMSHNVFECLLRGENYFKILEYVLKQNIKLQKEMMELAMNNPRPIVIQVDKEKFDVMFKDGEKNK